jgi:GNAT superfamily N-acetyltransferase
MTQAEPAEGVVIRPASRPGDLEWVVAAHQTEYDQEFGWDDSFTELVAQIVTSYGDHHDADREAGWIAEIGGERVGCIFCVATDDPSTAQLRILLVTDRARGLGVGSRLVAECVGFARGAGYRRMTLWTNDVLESARRIYEAAGFSLHDQQAHHSFGHDLVGQNWILDLD